MAMELSDLSAYISLPMSTLGEIMRTEFVTVAPEDTIGEAAGRGNRLRLRPLDRDPHRA
jgi:Mg/Co/Ni transporter MgtE